MSKGLRLNFFFRYNFSVFHLTLVQARYLRRGTRDRYSPPPMCVETLLDGRGRKLLCLVLPHLDLLQVAVCFLRLQLPACLASGLATHAQ